MLDVQCIRGRIDPIPVCDSLSPGVVSGQSARLADPEPVDHDKINHGAAPAAEDPPPARSVDVNDMAYELIHRRQAIGSRCHRDVVGYHRRG